MGLEYVGKTLLVKGDGKRILAVGDLHLGFEEALNRSGVFVSRKMFEEMIEYLDRVFEKIENVDEVVLLGDVKHVFGGVLGQEWKDVSGLLDYLNKKSKRVVIVKGNHDKIIEPIARKKDIEVKDYHIVGDVCFLHGDRDFVENYGKKIKTWVVGHGHPAVKISEPGGAKIEKFKCFLVGKFKGKSVVVVPSFFDYNVGSDPRENELGFVWDFNFDNFEVKVVQDETLDILSFGKLKKLG